MDDAPWNQRPLRVLDDREVLQYARLATGNYATGCDVRRDGYSRVAGRNVARGAARRMPRGDGHAGGGMHKVA